MINGLTLTSHLGLLWVVVFTCVDEWITVCTWLHFELVCLTYFSFGQSLIHFLFLPHSIPDGCMLSKISFIILCCYSFSSLSKCAAQFSTSTKELLAVKITSKKQEANSHTGILSAKSVKTHQHTLLFCNLTDHQHHKNADSVLYELRIGISYFRA